MNMHLAISTAPILQLELILPPIIHISSLLQLPLGMEVHRNSLSPVRQVMLRLVKQERLTSRILLQRYRQ
jgi:hypothetical protein